ncbi:hypothetical protein ElyMa_000782000 [Elysia marginata]|uniref:Major facilitator superfamily (MFS) profile domain-containing protein n=1 Tax=Elysia marginata TaxID=1093978 RepID=A0AAV4GUB9_9GAST|nr:hypothetical protein ElyMa_000782000 [Elysia marginata]
MCPPGTPFVVLSLLIRGMEALGFSAVSTSFVTILCHFFPKHYASVYSSFGSCSAIGSSISNSSSSSSSISSNNIVIVVVLVIVVKVVVVGLVVVAVAATAAEVPAATTPAVGLVVEVREAAVAVAALVIPRPLRRQ